MACCPINKKEIDDQFHVLIDSHRGLSSSGGPFKDLCDRCNWGDNWSDTKVDITAEVTVGSLLWAITGALASQ